MLLSVLCVVTYMLAGWAKISNGGWGWMHGDVLRNQIAFDNVRKAVMGDPYSAIGAFLVRHGWVFGPIAIAALVVELGSADRALSAGSGATPGSSAPGSSTPGP